MNEKQTPKHGCNVPCPWHQLTMCCVDWSNKPCHDKLQTGRRSCSACPPGSRSASSPPTEPLDSRQRWTSACPSDGEWEFQDTAENTKRTSLQVLISCPISSVFMAFKKEQGIVKMTSHFLVWGLWRNKVNSEIEYHIVMEANVKGAAFISPVSLTFCLSVNQLFIMYNEWIRLEIIIYSSISYDVKTELPHKKLK